MPRALPLALILALAACGGTEPAPSGDAGPMCLEDCRSAARAYHASGEFMPGACDAQMATDLTACEASPCTVEVEISSRCCR